MSDDYDYHSHRKAKEAREQINQTGDAESQPTVGEIQERAKQQSYSATVNERRDGFLLSEDDVTEFLAESHETSQEPTTSSEPLHKWVGENDAKKVHAYRKHRERWEDLFDEETIEEKRQEVDEILRRFARRIENET